MMGVPVVGGSGPIVSSDQPVVPPSVGMTPVAGMPPGQPPRRKKALLVAGGAALIALLIAGGVFGLYLPNTPGSVWNTGINRTGKAVDALATQASDKKQLDKVKGAEVTGDAKLSIGDTTFNGSLTSSYEQSKSDSGLSFDLKDSSGKTTSLSAKVQTELVKNSTYPNIYFQFNGLKALGLDAYLPGLSSYDGKWIVADSAYLESLSSSSSTKKTQQQLTTDDVAELTTTATKVSRQYLFSTKKDTAVIEKNSYVGKEKLDGMTTYHYTATINVAHATAYCKAIAKAEISTAAYKKLTGDDEAAISKAKTDADKYCDDGLKDKTDNKRAFDIWIDKKYKLIYKTRFTDKNNKANYVEFGQVYKGDDDLKLFANIIDGDSKRTIKATVTTNVKTYVTNTTITGKSDDTSSPFDLLVHFNVKPGDKSVNVTKPVNGIPVEQLLKALGIDPSMLGGASTTQVPSSSASSSFNLET